MSSSTAVVSFWVLIGALASMLLMYGCAVLWDRYKRHE